VSKSKLQKEYLIQYRREFILHVSAFSKEVAIEKARMGLWDKVSMYSVHLWPEFMEVLDDEDNV